ncbi:MAG: DUF5103 domain-containing protein [Bacteroidales bacterium]|jgi:hypothetical protein|nr:DUF5103 domain-containing protein [Bacteroidales bacterium]
MKFRLTWLAAASVLLQIQAMGQAGGTALHNAVYDARIKTVQLYRDEWNLSYPVMPLNGNGRLFLNFDLLGSESADFHYRFIHCTKDWTESSIFEQDYIEGFNDNPVEDCTPSFNTTVQYYHYRIGFPNDRVSLKRSGNYIIAVYRAGEPDRPVLMQRFMITEDVAAVKASMHRPLGTDDNSAGQQIDFTLTGLQGIVDPMRNIYAFVLQNGRWDNAKTNLKADFYRTGELQYGSLSGKNIFRGGNEYRYFDIRNLRYQTEYIKSIDYNGQGYNVLLLPSESREFSPYFYNPDFNGKYYIAVQDGRDFDTDADYVNVFFTLRSKQMIAGGKMYVSGGAGNWTFDKNSLMTYNAAAGQYECAMLLKQGYYNYEYTFLKDGVTDGSASLFEGNHYETENDYMILVYYRNPRDRYDRLIVAHVANTLNRPAG